MFTAFKTYIQDRQTKKVSPHRPAVHLRRKQPKKASQELGQALDLRTTAHGSENAKQQEADECNVNKVEKGTGLEISTFEKTVKDFKKISPDLRRKHQYLII